MVKTTGDGALVEFASVVDAVGCAVVIQRGMIVTSRNHLILRRNLLEDAAHHAAGE
jgi:class 3 adenylate cyclase